MSQWGFVGPSYVAANPGQDNQELINWFVEMDPNEPSAQAVQSGQAVAEAKTAIGLLGCPGLVALNTAFSGPYRGGWVLPGNTQALCVIGFSVVLIEINGSSNGRPTFSFTQVGSMTSSGGPVNIRDNGAGGFAVIADGSTTLGLYNVKTKQFQNYFQSAYLGSTAVIFVDGWFVFNQPGTQKFFTSPVYWNGKDNFNATYFALKDNASDNLVTMIENNRELWMLGEATTEPWFNAGNSGFPFSRIEGALLQIGCAAAQSVARTGDGLMWLARSERGGLAVIRTKGYQYEAVSTPAVSFAINSYGYVADAQAYIYSEDGHEFYVITFPQGDVTWVYDLNTGFWHKRAAFDPTTGLFHRQRIGGILHIGGMHLGGDYSNGRIYWQTRTAYKDDQYPLVALRRTPHVWDKADRNRVLNHRLQLDFFPGSGLATGQGSDPQAMLRWSNDGGQTWGNEHWRSVGKIGQTKSRVIWRRLGAARDRVYEVRLADPVKRDIAGASLMAEASQA